MNDFIFKSVDQETEKTELKVKGEIPAWIKGSLLRNGPGKYELGSDRLKHWFDGFSILHKFDIHDGKVWYKSKFLQSQDYIKNLKSGRIKSAHWGTVADPCANIFSKFFSAFSKPNPNNANVSVVKLGNRILAVSDFSESVEFDFETLETKGPIQNQDEFKNGYMFSAAHSCYDPETAEFFNCLGKPGPVGKHHVFKRCDESFKRNFIGVIKAPKHTYYHSFALTKRYFILIAHPLELNLLKLMFGRLLNIPYEGSYKWKPEHGTTFHLLDRETGKVKTYSSEAFFFFHTVNAYDNADEVVIDLCLYKDPSIIKDLYLETLKQNGVNHDHLSELCRITIHEKTGKVSIRSLSDEKFDLPAFNANKTFQQHRYVYGWGIQKTSDINDKLVKIDIETGKSLTWHEPEKYPSEPVFIQAPNAKTEDEGVILNIVLDAEKQNSFLLILDAMSFKEIGRAEAPIHLPIGLHAHFYAR